MAGVGQPIHYRQTFHAEDLEKLAPHVLFASLLGSDYGKRIPGHIWLAVCFLGYDRKRNLIDKSSKTAPAAGHI